jgi:uncharacterized protein DUF1552
VTSYRFRRRAFIAAMSGGVGLKIMLRNLEGSAQGMRSPGRLLVTHWPIGIVAGRSDALWKPTSGSVGGSYALKPFADLGLGPDMTVIRGLSTNSLSLNGGGGHEGGTVVLMTGRSAGGTRMSPIEPDDAFASPGGSYDQILLDNVPALQRPGQGYANSIADSRTDCGEISTKCLSYSTASQDVLATGGRIASEAKPLMPVLSPLQQYTSLFSGFVPGTPGTAGAGGGAGGGAAPRVADAVLKKLVGKRSVLDFAREELNQLKRLAPSEARNKLSNHTDAVVSLETQIVNAINARYPDSGGGGSTGAGSGGMGGGPGNGNPICGGTCTAKPTATPSDITGMPDWTEGCHGSYDDPKRGATDDAAIHAQVGELHLDVLKAAFICDLIRVGTFQWAPGPNHVGFKGMYPGDTAGIYQHHPVSHGVFGGQTTIGTTPDELTSPEARFLYNVELWYFTRHAENFARWKNAVDGCGNNLLDFTCVPFLTEVTTSSHDRSNMPAMIIGGKKLGFVHDRYVSGSIINSNGFWGTIAQAFGHTSTDAPFGPPIDGVWAKP